MNVLIVEDSLHAMLAAELILKRYGFTIDKAVDGKQGIEKGTSNKYDLIVMDIGLPHIDGIEATRQIMASSPSAKIVGLTANLKVQSRETLLDCGMLIAYEKPLLPFIVADIANRFSWFLPNNECALIDKLPGLDSEREINIRWEESIIIEKARKVGIEDIHTLKVELKEKFSVKDWLGLAKSVEKLQSHILHMGSVRLSLTCLWLYMTLTRNDVIDDDIASHYYRLVSDSIDLYLSEYNDVPSY